MRLAPIAAALTVGAMAVPALADCDTVAFSDVGWTDTTVNTAIATTVLEGWLDGVTTRDGGDGVSAVRAALGL